MLFPLYFVLLLAETPLPFRAISRRTGTHRSLWRAFASLPAGVQVMAGYGRQQSNEGPTRELLERVVCQHHLVQEMELCHRGRAVLEWEKNIIPAHSVQNPPVKTAKKWPCFGENGSTSEKKLAAGINGPSPSTQKIKNVLFDCSVEPVHGRRDQPLASPQAFGLPSRGDS